MNKLVSWLIYIGVTLALGLTLGVQLIIYIVTNYFDANDNVGGFSALGLGLLLGANASFAMYKIRRFGR